MMIDYGQYWNCECPVLFYYILSYYSLWINYWIMCVMRRKRWDDLSRPFSRCLLINCFWRKLTQRPIWNITILMIAFLADCCCAHPRIYADSSNSHTLHCIHYTYVHKYIHLHSFILRYILFMFSNKVLLFVDKSQILDS